VIARLTDDDLKAIAAKLGGSDDVMGLEETLRNIGVGAAKPTAEERELAIVARRAANGRHALYHGTRYSACILSIGSLLPIAGDNRVSLTRSAEVAAYWACLRRDDDEGHGAILVLNRRSLAFKQGLVAYHDPIFDTQSYRNDEMEEYVPGEIELGRHLIGLVTTERVARSAKQRRRAYERAKRVATCGTA
jgi:hypothetical protein